MEKQFTIPKKRKKEIVTPAQKPEKRVPIERSLLKRKRKERKDNACYHQTRKSYETAIKLLATEDWMLANDGIVTGVFQSLFKAKEIVEKHAKWLQ
jgi:hypothetical protein